MKKCPQGTLYFHDYVRTEDGFTQASDFLALTNALREFAEGCRAMLPAFKAMAKVIAEVFAFLLPTATPKGASNLHPCGERLKGMPWPVHLVVPHARSPPLRMIYTLHYGDLTTG